MPQISQPPQTTLTNITCWLKNQAFKAVTSTYFWTKPSEASYSKPYPCRPHLWNDFYLPPGYTANEKYPLYIDIHGGGFMIGNPKYDTPFCKFMAERGFIVVSINYGKAPKCPFPRPVQDAAAIASAVLDDKTISFDPERVAIGGFSAGGNLTLTISQLPDIRKRVKACVAFYPIVDFTLATNEKLSRKANPDEPDILTNLAALFNQAYIPPGQLLNDKLLSPFFADREDLPANIFFIVCEKDMLCHEARSMAEKLAGIEIGTGDRLGWKKDGIALRLIEGQPHGFDTMPKMGDGEAERIRERDSMWSEAGRWLLEEVFHDPK